MIYLMRHGESTVNVAHIVKCREPSGDLTEKGREQARLAGHWLANKGIKAIHASPFHRAQQSAAMVSQILGLPVETDEDLREIDCGDLEGREDREAWDAWLTTATRWRQGKWDVAFVGGETLHTAHGRLQRALTRACDQDTLLVTHGGIVEWVLPYLITDADTLPSMKRLENTGMVVLEPCEDGRYTCGGWNLVEHLAKDTQV